jgi:hypothetical protein
MEPQSVLPRSQEPVIFEASFKMFRKYSNFYNPNVTSRGFIEQVNEAALLYEDSAAHTVNDSSKRCCHSSLRDQIG